MSSNSTLPIDDLFGDKGWHLEKNLLDHISLEIVREFLINSKKRLQSQFEEWLGQSILTDEDYIRHQMKIPEYEDAGLPKDLRHYLTGEYDLQTRLDNKIVELLAGDRVREFLGSVLQSKEFGRSAMLGG